MENNTEEYHEIVDAWNKHTKESGEPFTFKEWFDTVWVNGPHHLKLTSAKVNRETKQAEFTVEVGEKKEGLICLTCGSNLKKASDSFFLECPNCDEEKHTPVQQAAEGQIQLYTGQQMRDCWFAGIRRREAYYADRTYGVPDLDEYMKAEKSVTLSQLLAERDARLAEEKRCKESAMEYNEHKKQEVKALINTIELNKLTHTKELAERDNRIKVLEDERKHLIAQVNGWPH